MPTLRSSARPPRNTHPGWALSLGPPQHPPWTGRRLEPVGGGRLFQCPCQACGGRAQLQAEDLAERPSKPRSSVAKGQAGGGAGARAGLGVRGPG